MARIETREYLDSTLIDKEFLKSLIQIADKNNPKIGIKTEITIASEQEKTTYENWDEFNESRLLPKKIKSISIKKTPYIKKEREKIISFFLYVDQDGDNSYYQLIGYDDGKLSTFKKEINNLLDKYKNWYAFLFNSSFTWVILELISFISFIFLMWRLLLKFSHIIEKEFFLGIGFGALGVLLYYYLHIFYEKAFPYSDFQISVTKRTKWLRNIITLIFSGLLINLIWGVINLII